MTVYLTEENNMSGRKVTLRSWIVICSIFAVLLCAPDLARAAAVIDTNQQTDQATRGSMFSAEIQRSFSGTELDYRTRTETEDPILKLVHCCHAHPIYPYDRYCCHSSGVYVAPRYGVGAASVRGVSRRTSRRTSRRVSRRR